MLSYMMHIRTGNILGDFGANQVHFGSKICNPKIAWNYDRIIVFNTYFTVLNVSIDRMSHPSFFHTSHSLHASTVNGLRGLSVTNAYCTLAKQHTSEIRGCYIWNTWLQEEIASIARQDMAGYSIEEPPSPASKGGKPQPRLMEDPEVGLGAHVETAFRHFVALCVCW